MRPMPPAYLACLVTLMLLSCAATVIYMRQEPLPAFGTLQAAEKKAAFFTYLKPKIERANADVLKVRQRLLRLQHKAAQAPLSMLDQRWLQKLAERYEVAGAASLDHPELLTALLHRVDIVPPSLALIQAAKESAWGTSRFAVNGNNLFGQQCFALGCGFTPSRREQGRRHEVAQFPTVHAAVAAYLHNLNTHPRYTELRAIRARQRAADGGLRGTILADGLLAYSERGEAYISEVKSMIRQNNLE